MTEFTKEAVDDFRRALDVLKQDFYPMSKPGPADSDAEHSLLGHCILHGSTDSVADEIKPEHFYSLGNQCIWRAMVEMTAAGSAIDVVTLKSHLESSGALANVGGISTLVEMTEAPAIGNPVPYAKTIVERWRVREAKKFLAIAASEAAEPLGGVQDWLDSLARRAGDLALSVANNETGASIATILMKQWRDLEARLRAGEVPGVPTGLRHLDGVLGGLYPGELYIIAGRPGVAKSSLAGGIAKSLGSRGIGAAVFSLEMPKEAFGMRMVCAEAEVDISKVRTGRSLTPEDWSKLTTATKDLNKLPIYIDDQPGMTLGTMRSKARRQLTEWGLRGHKTGVIFVDYLQLMRADHRVDSRQEEIAEISRGLKRMAKELNVSVVALSQLNRGVEHRDDKRPLLSDLRESGQVEQDADAVLMLYRDELYNPNTDATNQCEIILAKHRNGPTGTVVVRFDGKYTKFSDWES